MAGLLLAVLALLAVCFSDNHINRYKLYVRSFIWGRESFDSAEWQREDPDDWKMDKRSRMLFSFLCRYSLKGMPRVQVEQLLGPAPTGRYQIGYVTGFGIDPDDLHIEYDASGNVEDYYTRQH